MSRKLVSLRRVSEIRPIHGADSIELAITDGWQCVVKKGEFKRGDLGIYFEIDSLLPRREPFLFLEPYGVTKIADGSEGYRIKTRSIRKHISQGLLLPLASFPELAGNVKEGDDLTDIIGVKKYEPPTPAQLGEQAKGPFPSFIPKTDAERIQNHPEYFEMYAGYEFEATEKLDGTSCTYYWKDGEFGVCSRNIELKKDDRSIHWKLAEEYKIRDKLASLGKNYALQGEIVGEKVQGNPYKISGQRFYLFNVWDIDEQRYLPTSTRLSLAKALEIDHVPVIDVASKPFEYTMQQLVEVSDGSSLLNSSSMREGIVYKGFPSDKWQVSFKVISNKYLLAHA